MSEPTTDLSPRSSALIIVDMQAEGCERHGIGVKPVIVKIRTLLDRFRQADGRIIHVQSVRTKDHPEFTFFGKQYSLIDDTPAVALIRQVLGAVVQFEKVALVAKLKGARDRKRRATGKCEGRRSHADTRPDMVALAKRLRRANPKTGERLSYQRISAQLAEAGFFNENGRPFNSKSVMAMVTHRVEKAATPATAD